MKLLSQLILIFTLTFVGLPLALANDRLDTDCQAEFTNTFEAGKIHFQKGDIETAIICWEETLKQFSTSPWRNSIKYIDLLRRLATAYQSLGYSYRARNSLYCALFYAQHSTQDQTRTKFQIREKKESYRIPLVGIFIQLGEVYRQMGNFLEDKNPKIKDSKFPNLVTTICRSPIQLAWETYQNKLAKGNESITNFDKADYYLQMATCYYLQIKKDQKMTSKNLLENSRLVANILNQKGNLLMTKQEKYIDDFSVYRKNYKDALDFYKNAYGKNLESDEKNDCDKQNDKEALKCCNKKSYENYEEKENCIEQYNKALKCDLERRELFTQMEKRNKKLMVKISLNIAQLYAEVLSIYRKIHQQGADIWNDDSFLGVLEHDVDIDLTNLLVNHEENKHVKILEEEINTLLEREITEEKFYDKKNNQSWMINTLKSVLPASNEVGEYLAELFKTLTNENIDLKSSKTRASLKSFLQKGKNKNIDDKVEKALEIALQDSLKNALENLKKLPASYEKSFGLITIAHLAENLPVKKAVSCSQQLNWTPQEIIFRVKPLEQALKLAKKQPDLISYVKGSLAKLYADKQCYPQAITTTKEAISELLKNQTNFFTNRPELLFRWYQQLGDFLQKQNPQQPLPKDLRQIQQPIKKNSCQIHNNKLKKSWFAYKCASEFLQQIPRHYRCGLKPLISSAEQFRAKQIRSFLQWASNVEEKNKQMFLRQVREQLELFKIAELRNYFQDDCITEPVSTDDLDQVFFAHPQTAILYTFLDQENKKAWFLLNSKNHLELQESTLKDLTSTVNNILEEIEKIEVLEREGQIKLRTHYTQLWRGKLANNLKSLYETIIKPFDTNETKLLSKINNLIIVPDGILRTLPFAALYDGEKFLIEKVTLAIQPSVKLVNIEKPIIKLKPGSSALLSAISDFKDHLGPVSCALLGKATSCLDKNIKQLKGIEQLEGIERLEGKVFTITNIKEKFSNKSKNYPIVHFSTHGEFKSNPNESYIQAHKPKQIKMKQFRQLLEEIPKPVELLTFSACETALGNERAALGLTGVAVETGVHSAIGTLWIVEENSTKNLIADFYNKWRNNKDEDEKKGFSNKAEALKQAQLKLLKTKTKEGKEAFVSHPYFWAPFLLVGNWL